MANHFLATVLIERLSEFEEAIPYAERSIARGNRLALGLLLLALSKAGRVERLAEVETQIETIWSKDSVPNWISAMRAVANSDRDSFLQAIERAVEVGEFSTEHLAVWSFADFVRDDPRFQSVLRRLRLEDVPRCPASWNRSGK
jgi:hypothetical protein